MILIFCYVFSKPFLELPQDLFSYATRYGNLSNCHKLYRVLGSLRLLISAKSATRSTYSTGTHADALLVPVLVYRTSTSIGDNGTYGTRTGTQYRTGGL